MQLGSTRWRRVGALALLGLLTIACGGSRDDSGGSGELPGSVEDPPGGAEVVAPADTGSLAELTQFSAPPLFEPSGIPSALAWADDDSGVYVGYLTGPTGTTIAGFGNVRLCTLGSDYCEHAVAVKGGVRALAVDAGTVYAGDNLGFVTALPAPLFKASATTTGLDGEGFHDGTGGCLDGTADRPHAKACPPTAVLGLHKPYDPLNPVLAAGGTMTPVEAMVAY